MEYPQPGESQQRTKLAGDRTLLAWLRTAFAAYAVAIGAGALLPKLTDTGSIPYRIIGVAFALVGLFAVALGLAQYLLPLDDCSPSRRPGVRLNVVFGVVVGVLGVAIAVVIAVAP